VLGHLTGQGGNMGPHCARVRLLEEGGIGSLIQRGRRKKKEAGRNSETKKEEKRTPRATGQTVSSKGLVPAGLTQKNLGLRQEKEGWSGCKKKDRGEKNAGKTIPSTLSK